VTTDTTGAPHGAPLRTVVCESTDEPPYRTLYVVLEPGQAVDPLDLDENAPVPLTDQQAQCAAEALRLYRERTAVALDMIERGVAAKTAALDLYRQATAWLDDAYAQAERDADAARERREDDLAQQERIELDAHLAQRDAALGPRGYVRVRIPVDQLTREQRRYGNHAPDTWRLHRGGCTRVARSYAPRPDPESAPPGDESQLRAAAALELLLGGAQACGLCRPGDRLAQDPRLAADDRARVGAEQTRRSEVVKSLSARALHDALGPQLSLTPTIAGCGVVSLAGPDGRATGYLAGRIELRQGESVIGYRSGYRRGWEAVPLERRTLLEEMAREQGWHGRWCPDTLYSGSGSGGGAEYFAVRRRTLAEARAARAAKDASDA